MKCEQKVDMAKKNNMFLTSEEKALENVEDSRETNDCRNCMEGCMLGENVYCNINGRFYDINDNFTCKNYMARNL